MNIYNHAMEINFKQKILLAIIGGIFTLIAAFISNTDPNNKGSSSNHINISNPMTYSYAEGGNSSAVSNVNINMQDNRVMATDNAIVIQGANN
jgi:hypothetical protein